MNAKKSSRIVPLIVISLVYGQVATGQTAQDLVRSGNTLYHQGQYDQAVTQYDKALTENPRLDHARFNKADALLRLDDLAKAMDLYNEVSAGTRDMDLVKKAKYNLGNAYFQRGIKQRDSDLQKALDDLKTSIGFWRAVLDLDPANENAKRNKEVAGLVIKDILDQIKKQQEQKKPDPNQPQDPNRAKQDQGQQPQQGQQGGEKQDPNQTSESGSQKPESGKGGKQGQDPNQAKDPNQSSEPQSQNSEPRPQEQVTASDRTAQEILDREQQKKKERQVQVRAGYMPVDKDW